MRAPDYPPRPLLASPNGPEGPDRTRSAARRHSAAMKPGGSVHCTGRMRFAFVALAALLVACGAERKPPLNVFEGCEGPAVGPRLGVESARSVMRYVACIRGEPPLDPEPGATFHDYRSEELASRWTQSLGPVDTTRVRRDRLIGLDHTAVRRSATTTSSMTYLRSSPATWLASRASTDATPPSATSRPARRRASSRRASAPNRWSAASATRCLRPRTRRRAARCGRSAATRGRSSPPTACGADGSSSDRRGDRREVEGGSCSAAPRCRSASRGSSWCGGPGADRLSAEGTSHHSAAFAAHASGSKGSSGYGLIAQACSRLQHIGSDIFVPSADRRRHSYAVPFSRLRM